MLFSVIVPLYNKRPHVSRFVSSVLAQTYTNFELIVVDDCSSDGSLEELDSFTDSRLKVYRREAPGPGGYAARNLGISESRGKYIAFLDADDEWFPDHLHKMHFLSENFPDAGFLASGYERCNDKINQCFNNYYMLFKQLGAHETDFHGFLLAYIKYERFCHTSVVVVKRELFEEVGGFPAGATRKGGDLYTWLKLTKATKLAWSPHIGARVYHNAVNQVTKTEYFNPDFIYNFVRNLGDGVSQNDRYLLKCYVNGLLYRDYLRGCALEGRRKFSLVEYTHYVSFPHFLRNVFIGLISPKLIQFARNWRHRNAKK